MPRAKSRKNLPAPPYREPFFRFLNLMVRLAPVKSKGYHNYILMKKDLRKGLHALTYPPGLEFSPLREEDLPSLEGRFGAFPVDVYRRRLGAGHHSMCVRKDGVIAGFHWASTGRACHFFGTENQWVTFELPEETSFFYDFFVFKEFRGRMIAMLMEHHFIDSMVRKGYPHAMTAILHWNLASLKLAVRAGAEPAGFEHLYRIGTKKISFKGTEKEARRLVSWCKEL